MISIENSTQRQRRRRPLPLFSKIPNHKIKDKTENEATGILHITGAPVSLPEENEAQKLTLEHERKELDKRNDERAVSRGQEPAASKAEKVIENNFTEREIPQQQNFNSEDLNVIQLWNFDNSRRFTPIPPQTTPALDNYKLLELYEAAMLSPVHGSTSNLRNKQNESNLVLPLLDNQSRTLAPYTPRPPSWGVNSAKDVLQRAETTPNKKRFPGLVFDSVDKNPPMKDARPETSNLPPYMVRSTVDDVDRLPAIHPSVWASRGEKRVEYRAFITAPPMLASAPTTDAARRGIQLNATPIKKPTTGIKKKKEAPGECWRCALHLDHVKCEIKKYIRIGGGYRHGYKYVKEIIEKAKEEQNKKIDQARRAQLKIFQEKLAWRIGADGKRERRIKTYVRTSSGRKVAKFQYVSEDVYEEMMKLRDEGGSESAKQKLREKLRAAGIETGDDEDLLEWDAGDVALEEIAFDEEGNPLLDETGEPILLTDTEKVKRAARRHRKERGLEESDDEESRADSGLAFDEREERARRKGKRGDLSDSDDDMYEGGGRKQKGKKDKGGDSEDDYEFGGKKKKKHGKHGEEDDDSDSIAGVKGKKGKGKRGGKKGFDDSDDDSLSPGKRGKKKGKGKKDDDADSAYSGGSREGKRKGKKGKKGKGRGVDSDDSDDFKTGKGKKGRKKKGKKGFDDDDSDDDNDFGKSGRKKKGRKGKNGGEDSGEDSSVGGKARGKKGKKGRRHGDSDDSFDSDGGDGNKKKHRHRHRGHGGKDSGSESDFADGGGGRRKKGRRRRKGSAQSGDSDYSQDSGGVHRKHKHRHHRREGAEGEGSGYSDDSRSGSRSRSHRKSKHRSRRHGSRSDYGSEGSSMSGSREGGHRKHKKHKRHGHRHRDSSFSGSGSSGASDGEGGRKKHKKHKSRHRRHGSGGDRSHSDYSSERSDDSDRSHRRRRHKKHRKHRRRHSSDSDYSVDSQGRSKHRSRRHRRHSSYSGESDYSGDSDRSRHRRRRRKDKKKHRHRDDSLSDYSSEDSHERRRRRRERRRQRRKDGEESDFSSDSSSRSRGRHKKNRRHRRRHSSDSGSSYSRSRSRRRKSKKHRRHRSYDSDSESSSRSHRRGKGRRKHRRRSYSYSNSNSSGSRRRGKGRRRHRRRSYSDSDSDSYSSDDSYRRRRRHRRRRKYSDDSSDSDSSSDYSRRHRRRGKGRHRRRSTSTEESSAGDEKSRRRKDKHRGRHRRYSDSESDSDDSNRSRRKKKKKPPRPPSTESSLSSKVSSARLNKMSKKERRAYERRRREKEERLEKKKQQQEEYDRYVQKQERRKERERRSNKGEVVSSSSSDEYSFGDGRTAVKYGKGSRRGKKDEYDDRDIGYDDPNDPWGPKKGRKKDKKQRDRRHKDGRRDSYSGPESSEESEYEIDPKDPTKMRKKEKSKRKGKGKDDLSSESDAESIYEDVFKEDGTVERRKIKAPKKKGKKKYYDDDELDAESEYDSIGSAEADKLIARQIYGKDGEVIRLTRSGRRIKDGKISKEVFDLDKHQQKKEKRRRDKAMLEKSYEEEYVEEFIDDEGQVVRVVKKRLKGQNIPGKRPTTPLLGTRRVQVLFLKGGRHMKERLEKLLQECPLNEDPRYISTKSKTLHSDDDEGAVDLDEREGTIDYLAHYRLVDPEKLESYGKAFLVEDSDENFVLSASETKIALEGVPGLQGLHDRQLHFILKILGIDDATLVTFKMFAVIAAIAERFLAVVDEQTKQWMELDDLMDIERKMGLYRAMFYWNVGSDRSPNYIKASSLRVELIAGGLSRTQEDFVMEKVEQNEYREVSFLDYMAFVPLFLCTHENILDNPLDMRRNKFTGQKAEMLLPQRDMVPLGRAIGKISATKMESFPLPYVFEQIPGSGPRKRIRLRLPQPPVEERPPDSNASSPPLSPAPTKMARPNRKTKAFLR